LFQRGRDFEAVRDVGAAQGPRISTGARRCFRSPSCSLPCT
jgi:hypothetical protein